MTHEIAKIDQEYGDLCRALGDAVLRKEAVDLQIGTIRAQVQRLRNRKAELESQLAGNEGLLVPEPSVEPFLAGVRDAANRLRHRTVGVE